MSSPRFLGSASSWPEGVPGRCTPPGLGARSPMADERHTPRVTRASSLVGSTCRTPTPNACQPSDVPAVTVNRTELRRGCWGGVDRSGFCTSEYQAGRFGTLLVRRRAPAPGTVRRLDPLASSGSTTPQQARHQRLHRPGPLQCLHRPIQPTWSLRPGCQQRQTKGCCGPTPIHASAGDARLSIPPSIRTSPSVCTDDCTARPFRSSLRGSYLPEFQQSVNTPASVSQHRLPICGSRRALGNGPAALGRARTPTDLPD